MCTLENLFYRKYCGIYLSQSNLLTNLIDLSDVTLFFSREIADENIIYLPFKEIYVAVSRHSYKRPQIEILLRNQCSLQSSVLFLTVPSLRLTAGHAPIHFRLRASLHSMDLPSTFAYSYILLDSLEDFRLEVWWKLRNYHRITISLLPSQ